MELNISMFCKKISCFNRFYFVRSGITILLLRSVCKTQQILLFVTLSVVVYLQISNCTKLSNDVWKLLIRNKGKQRLQIEIIGWRWWHLHGKPINKASSVSTRLVERDLGTQRKCRPIYAVKFRKICHCSITQCFSSWHETMEAYMDCKHTHIIQITSRFTGVESFKFRPLWSWYLLYRQPWPHWQNWVTSTLYKLWCTSMYFSPLSCLYSFLSLMTEYCPLHFVSTD